jgi:hypothetical protein
MTPKTIADYEFQNKEIIKNNSKYLKGYCLGLSFVYSISGINKKIVDMILKSSSWKDLHRKGSIIYKEEIEKKNLSLIGEDIFEEQLNFKLKKFSKKVISDKKELAYVLENRSIKVAGVDERYDLPLIYSILLGKTKLSDQTQVIEFLIVDKEGDKKYHYAIYMFQGTSMSNGSYWYLLKDVAIENDWEPFSSEKAQVTSVINRNPDSFSFSKYKIKEELLEDYIKEKDPNYRDSVNLKNRLKDSNSLLIELIGIYLGIRNNKDSINIMWGIETNNKSKTDIDGLIIFKDKIKIIQAQSTFYKDEKKLEEHFKKCVDYLQIYLKKVKLGKIKDYKLEKEVFVLFNSDPFNSKEDKKKIKYLKQNNINVVFLESEIKKNPLLLEKTVRDKVFRTCRGDEENE